MLPARLFSCIQHWYDWPIGERANNFSSWRTWCQVIYCTAATAVLSAWSRFPDEYQLCKNDFVLEPTLILRPKCIHLKYAVPQRAKKLSKYVLECVRNFSLYDQIENAYYSTLDSEDAHRNRPEGLHKCHFAPQQHHTTYDQNCAIWFYCIHHRVFTCLFLIVIFSDTSFIQEVLVGRIRYRFRGSSVSLVTGYFGDGIYVHMHKWNNCNNSDDKVTFSYY